MKTFSTYLTLLFLTISIVAFSAEKTKKEILLKQVESKEESSLDLAKSLDELSIVYYLEQDYASAILSRNKSYKIYKKHNDQDKEIASLEFIGIVYAEISDFERSLEYFLKALKKVDLEKNPEVYYSLKLNIGTTYIEATNSRKGIGYLNEVIPYYREESTKSAPHLIAAYTNLGVGYQNINKLDSALWSHEQSIEIVKQNKLKNQLAGPLINLGDLHVLKGNYNKAQNYYTEALEHFNNSKDIRGVWHSKVGLATVYIHQQKYDEAEVILKDGITYFRTINDLKYIIDCYKKLSEIFKKKEDYQQALFLS